MNDGREYRFQKSITIGNEMYVIRADDWEEFVKAKNQMESIVPKTKAFPDDFGPIATPQEKVISVPLCPIHNRDMVMKPAGVSKTTGKPYPAFWSCPTRNADGSYCNYRPEKG